MSLLYVYHMSPSLSVRVQYDVMLSNRHVSFLCVSCFSHYCVLIIYLLYVYVRVESFVMSSNRHVSFLCVSCFSHYCVLIIYLLYVYVRVESFVMSSSRHIYSVHKPLTYVDFVNVGTPFPKGRKHVIGRIFN